ncbi:MAG: UDP-N-acetylmuramate--L-alanine ligase [Oscillospiraceae bacterium]|nr:UDP-N-acetylmuramate--L-alanine ligase [Oscillospiraceae bacterium]
MKKIFFVGIGGISMSSLADISRLNGHTVAGYDWVKKDITEKLIQKGINISYENLAENVEGYDLVVYTSAIPEDNPQLLHALELNIPCVRRDKFLGELMLDYKYRIGVAGMHGKSTTTSMISNIYLNTELDPTIVNGTEMDELNGLYRLGSKEYFIFEACEYTDSFLAFYPTTAVVLNIEMDHPDYFHSMDHILDSFKKYINIAGKSIVNLDCENVKKICDTNSITFGIINPDVNYRSVNISYKHGFACFDILHDDEFFCYVELSVPGDHNIYNALASAAAAHQNGVNAEQIAYGLSAFKGAKRRFEYKGMFNGVYLYEDYAHHPSEIKTTLTGIRHLGYNKVWCIFQPHTFSRTAELFDDFANSFGEADEVILVDIFAARETNQYGVTSKMLAEKIEGAVYCDSFESAADHVKNNAAAGDIVVLMGAGDVNKIGDYLL